MGHSLLTSVLEYKQKGNLEFKLSQPRPVPQTMSFKPDSHLRGRSWASNRKDNMLNTNYGDIKSQNACPCETQAWKVNLC